MKYAQILNNKVHCIFEDDLTLEELGQQKYNLKQITLVDITNATDVAEGYDYVNGEFSNINLIFGKIGTTQYKIKRISDGYTPTADEVLMSALPTTTTDVAKEDGTWLTPAQDYLVYKCSNGACVLDINATYAKIELSYEHIMVNNFLAKIAADISLSKGTITQEQYATAIANIETTHSAIITEMSAKKAGVSNG